MKQGVVVIVHRDDRFLVIRRAAHILAGGAWCFVGGAIDPGESHEDAVAREFHEEVGGRVRPVAKIWEYARPDGSLRLHWWLAELEDGTLRANPPKSPSCAGVRRTRLRRCRGFWRATWRSCRKWAGGWWNPVHTTGDIRCCGDTTPVPRSRGASAGRQPWRGSADGCECCPAHS